jgi:D-beta-D-heptose 7-phosphate kinase/D-beta-D-heptose 1-phosphate adenosyltransferase
VDPKDEYFYSYRGVAVVTPNQHEAAEVLGYKLRDDATVTRAGEQLLERLESRAVLITRGAAGMSLFERGAPRRDYPATAREVYDVTGAGDTVVGTYATALSGGASAGEAAALSNAAAGDVVRHLGTAVPDPGALFDAAGGD